MVKEDNNNKESQIIEHGDIFFFYRPKVGTEEVEDIGDVQRFYMITSPEEKGKRHSNNDIYRLFLVGQNNYPKLLKANLLQKKGTGL